MDKGRGKSSGLYSGKKGPPAAFKGASKGGKGGDSSYSAPRAFDSGKNAPPSKGSYGSSKGDRSSSGYDSRESRSWGAPEERHDSYGSRDRGWSEPPRAPPKGGHDVRPAKGYGGGKPSWDSRGHDAGKSGPPKGGRDVGKAPAKGDWGRPLPAPPRPVHDDRGSWGSSQGKGSKGGGYQESSYSGGGIKRDRDEYERGGKASSFKGSDKGGPKGGDRFGFKGSDKGGGYRVPDKGGPKGSDKGGFKGGDKGGFKGGDKGGFKGGDKGGFKGSDKGSFKGGDKGGFKGGKDSAKGGGYTGKGDHKGGKAAQKMAAGERFYVGTVRLFNPEKKNGFIDCPDLRHQSGQDVYVFQDVLERGLAGPGDRVAFFVHWSSKGQPQASHPLLRLKTGEGSEEAYALKGSFKPAPAGEFGFIECVETKDYFGRDVYVNKDVAAGLTDGQTVSFNAYLNRDGMPNAEDAVVCDEDWQPRATDLSEFKEVDTSKGKGKGAKGADELSEQGIKGASKGPKGGGPPPEPTGRMASGVIKSFNQANNYGFIECEELKTEYGSDVFVHGKEFTGFGVGDKVRFEVGINSKGQPQGLQLELLEAASEEPAAKRQKTDEPEKDADMGNSNSAPAEEEPYPAEADESAQGQESYGTDETWTAADGSWEGNDAGQTTEETWEGQGEAADGGGDQEGENWGGYGGEENSEGEHKGEGDVSFSDMVTDEGA